MKIFLSWSGKPSHSIAVALRDWLPLLFTGVELFLSSESIRKGKRWQVEIAKELEGSNFGIVCLTPENCDAPWLVFESGALSKLKESSLSTLLTGGLRTSDVEGPLSHFQHTIFEREDFFKLMLAINEAQPTGKQDPARLHKVFEKFWDELAANVEKALKTEDAPEKKRSLEDMLRELLDVTNSIAKNMPKVDSQTSAWEKLIGDKLRKDSPFWSSIGPSSLHYLSGPFERDRAQDWERLVKMVEALGPNVAHKIHSNQITGIFEYGRKALVLSRKGKKIGELFTSNDDLVIREALDHLGYPEWAVGYI